MYTWRQFTNLEKIKTLGQDEQRREYYRYQSRMFEASSTSPSSAAAGAAGGKPYVAPKGSATIFYRMELGTFTYAVTNFDDGKTYGTTNIAFAEDATIDNVYEIQDGGYIVRIHSDTDAIDYILYIDIKGRVETVRLDYSLELSYFAHGRYNITYYYEEGFSTLIVFDRDGLREIKIAEEVQNILDWDYQNTANGALVFNTVTNDIHKIYSLKDRQKKAFLLLEVDTTEQDYFVYVSEISEVITVRTTDKSLNDSTERIRIFDTSAKLLSEYDTTTLAKAEYTTLAGNTIQSIAASQSCTTETLIALNPGYDFDNINPGDVINGFSSLTYSTISFFENSNFTLLLETQNLSGPGMLHIFYFDRNTGKLDLQTHTKNYTYAFYEGIQRNWESTYTHVPKSKLYVIYTNEYEYRSNEYEPDYSYNDMLYANSTYLLPIFQSDNELRQPILWATQSSFLPSGSFNELWLSKGFHLTFQPKLDEDQIQMVVDTNRWGPGLFHFTDYSTTPNQISDGGLDLWDNTGNRISADGDQLAYTHTQQEKGYGLDNSQPVPQLYRMGLAKPYYRMNGTVSTSSSLGASASYFTNLYPGMFVLCAKQTDFDQFKIYGETGHDSQGSTYSNSFQITSSNSNVYQVFAKCIHEDTIDRTTDPSINHILIVNSATSSGITHTISPDTNQDLDQLDGLQGRATEISYILMTQLCDERLTDDQIIEIATKYVNIIDGLDTAQSLAALNEAYETLTDVTDKSTVKYSILNIDKDGSTSTKLIDVYKSETMYQMSTSRDTTLIKATQSLEAFGKFGFDGLPDVSARSWSTFYNASNSETAVIGTEFVMWSVRTDNYYKISFTNWQTGFGADAFAYTRQLITPTMDESVITFTHSSMSETTDVIEQGTLELTRSSFGTLKNVAQQSYNISFGPLGTLWNSTYSNTTLLKSTLVDAEGESSTIEFNEFDGADEIRPDTTYHLDTLRLESYYSITGNAWSKIEELYDDRVNPENFVDPNGYGQSGTLFINNKNRVARFLSKDGISATFSIQMNPSSGYSFRDIQVNDEYAVFVYGDGSGIWVIYRGTDGSVRDSLKIEDTSFDNFRVAHVKNRYYVTYYDDDMNFEVLVFDGNKITKVLSVPDPDENFEDAYNDMV